MINEEKLASQVKPFICICEKSFYHIELPEATVIDYARCNTGIIRIELTETNEVVWNKSIDAMQDKIDGMQRAIDLTWAAWTQGAPLSEAVSMIRDLTTCNEIKPRPDYCCIECGKEAQELSSRNWLIRENPGDIPSRWICAQCKKKQS